MVTRDTVRIAREAAWGEVFTDADGEPVTVLANDEVLAICDLAEAALGARSAIHARVVGCQECNGAGFYDDGGGWGTKGCDSCFPFRALLSHLSPPTHQDEERA